MSYLRDGDTAASLTREALHISDEQVRREQAIKEDDLVQRLRNPNRGWHPDQTEAADEIERLSAHLAESAAEVQKWYLRADKTWKEKRFTDRIAWLESQLAEQSLELRKANIKLRDRAHPSAEPRDPPEVLASAGFWPDCGCGECYAIHCLGNALAQLAERDRARR